MHVLHTIREFRTWRQSAGNTVTFVPTMGALHEGHASLVRAARVLADQSSPRGTVAASIFVNPTQFGPNEDFTRYPRTLESDTRMLAAAGCDAVFVPDAKEMYPTIDATSTASSLLATSIDPGPLGNVLEGAIRPGHFRGVCTVVAKLLHIVQPSHMLLGQKDYQQQAILRQMCAELNEDLEVVTCPTIREEDGLAMSSRNRYLTADERTRAATIYRALEWARQTYAQGERQAVALEEGMSARVATAGLIPQYTHVAHAENLTLVRNTGGTVQTPAILLIAALLGKTRLIDNMAL